MLIAAVGIGYRVTQAYYFVARDGTEVAIFRGVNTQFGPLKFFDVYKNTDLVVKDLQPAVRSQVEAGITARNERDAELIVVRLHGQLLPICRLELPPPTATPTSSATGSRSAASSHPPSRPRSAGKTTSKVTAKTTPKTPPNTGAKSSTTASAPAEIPTLVPNPDDNCRAA